MTALLKSTALATCFLIISTAANGMQLGDFVGTWFGQRTQTVNGSGYYSSVEIRAKKTATGGLAVTEIGNSEWMGGTYTFKHNFKAGGKYHAVIYSGGLIESTCNGTWSKSGSSIYISGTQSSSEGKSHFSGSLRLVTKSRISYSGKSGGVTIKINAKRG